MAFPIEQISSLELIKNDEDSVTIELDDLTESGDHKIVGKPSFKEDDEIRAVNFVGNVEQEQVTVQVLYSYGVNGSEVQEVNVTKIPKSFRLETSPNFECKECDDSEF